MGKGRRMPVQQSVDIGVPLETVYNQWTQFELWPDFMQRVTRVTQEDHCTVSFAVKVWGKTKEFTAQIDTQRPDERIKWKVTQGMNHTGVVTFHELGPRLTRIEVNLDVEPGSLIEKMARGMRFVKRAVRADMARFKAYVLMKDDETGEWRGTIEDGEVKSEGESESESSSSGGRSSSRRRRESSNGDGDGDSESSSSGGRSSGRSRRRGSSNGSSSSSGGRSSGSSRRRSGSRS